MARVWRRSNGRFTFHHKHFCNFLRLGHVHVSPIKMTINELSNENKTKW